MSLDWSLLSRWKFRHISSFTSWFIHTHSATWLKWFHYFTSSTLSTAYILFLFNEFLRSIVLNKLNIFRFVKIHQLTLQSLISMSKRGIRQLKKLFLFCWDKIVFILCLILFNTFSIRIRCLSANTWLNFNLKLCFYLILMT